MAKKKKTTKAPTGLSISRSGLNFTCSWKIGDSDYGAGQWFDGASIGKKVTSKSKSINQNNYYPKKSTKCPSVKFKVKGKRSATSKVAYKASATSSNQFNLYAPSTPSISADLSSDGANKCKFEWSTSTSDSDNRPFCDCECQTILREDVPSSNMAHLDWSGAKNSTSGSSGSIEITEDSSVIEGKSYCRAVRVRSRGVAGASGWAYAYHVYAMPYTPIITNAHSDGDDTNRHTKVEWMLQTGHNHPVDSMKVQYTIGVPDAGLTCPSGSSWTDAKTILQYDSTNAAEFNSDSAISTDDCMWVRVVASHDDNNAYSTPALASAGKLATPSLNTGTATGTTLVVECDNNSGVEDSFNVIYVKLSTQPDKALPIAIIPHGETSVTAVCPDVTNVDSYQLGAKTVVGSYEAQETSEGYTLYNVDEKMVSSEVWQANTEVAQAPKAVTALRQSSETIRVSWDWAWKRANQAVISWADHEDAWESTEEPSSFSVEKKATAWNVGGLDEGSTYWVRVKLVRKTSDDEVHSAWSEPCKINLASTPTAPTLASYTSSVSMDGELMLVCGYSGSGDFYVEIAEMVNGEIVKSNGHPAVLLSKSSSTSLSLTPDTVNETYEALGSTNRWTEGSIHYLAARITVEGGTESTAWSDPVAVKVSTKPIVASITADFNDTTESVIGDDGIEQTRSYKALTSMPFTVSSVIEYASTIRATVSRAEAYTIDRPDGQNEYCYQDEIVLSDANDSGSFTFDVDDLKGRLDDGAQYDLTVTAIDDDGNSDSMSIRFEVAWEHQPEIPTASIVVDEDNLAVQITADKPESYVDGDVIDIYRLSADRPELIIQNGSYGQTYVDPYPTFGTFGGHRIVAKTANGDYITSDNMLAWVDLDEETGDVIENKSIVIDFGGDSIELPYDISLSNSWTKDFQSTKYLGGSIVGDWNRAVERSLSASSNALSFEVDEDNKALIQSMRALASYAGACHIRTPEGSSFACDVQVSEDQSADSGHVIAYDLTITRVDSEGFDGMTYEEWLEEVSDE